MSDPMTPERLVELREAIDAAPRRLAIEPHVYVAGTDCSCPDRDRTHTPGYSLTVSVDDWTRKCSHCDHGILTATEAEGVSTLVALAPDLVAEVERLRAIVAAVEALHQPITVQEECRCDELDVPCPHGPVQVCTHCCRAYDTDIPPIPLTETCATEHEALHEQGGICPTRAALDGGE